MCAHYALLLAFFIAFTKTHSQVQLQAAGTAAPTIACDAPGVASCVDPGFTCMYTEFFGTQRIYNVYIGYFTQKTVPRDNVHYLTDATGIFMSDTGTFTYPGDPYWLHVTNATYFNLTVGSNGYDWSPEQTIGASQTCRSVSNGLCGPNGIEVAHFCQDSLFCNGIETCEAGICINGTDSCNVSSQTCNDTAAQCINNTVPTDAPTVVTAAPTVITNAPTVITDAPTVATGAPTVATGAPTVATDAPTVATDAPTVVTAAPVSSCVALHNCVTPSLTCVYATYEEGSRAINLLLGYDNTASEDIPYSELASEMSTDGEVVPLYNYTVYGEGPSVFVFLVKNATYLNWTIGVEELVWLAENTVNDTESSCRGFTGDVCGFVGLPDYCEDFSFCTHDFCGINNTCVSTPRCNASESLVCNEVILTCDEILAGAPGPNTGSPSLENSPLSLPIIIIPVVVVLVAAVAIYLSRAGFRPSRRL